MWPGVLCGVLLLLTGRVLEAHRGQEAATHFTNEWAVRVEGGPRVARLVAARMGYSFKGPIIGFSNTYLMVKADSPRTHKRANPHLTERLVQDDRVVWAEQQFTKPRQKRDFIQVLPPDDGSPPRAAASAVPRRRSQLRRRYAASESAAAAEASAAGGATSRREDELNATAALAGRLGCAAAGVTPAQSARLFNDELWPRQWYLMDTRTRLDLPKLDLHVLPVYCRGITGRGVRVTVLDDGMEKDHEDLRDNYDPDISYDVDDGDLDPSPRYDPSTSNAHGTRCAGEIAMKANNRKCGVGVAFNARIGGVRLLDGEVNDRMEGTALGWAHHLVDIYSASWGPNDDGKTVEGPGRLALEAMKRGVTEGRGGKGSIYVWASGNGGTFGDNCNCDGYVNAVYTLAIGSASERGHFPWYGERCASTMATAYSSGAYWDQMIATTDLRNSCTIRHTGTSAAAPLAAGIIALALEANPALTWRDVQHLVASSSEYAPLADNPGWRQNAAGFWVNTRFGFGLLNADELVHQAQDWVTVPDKAVCVVDGITSQNASFVRGERIAVLFASDGCGGGPPEQAVNFLEHVEVSANVEYPVRGALEMYLTSPAGEEIIAMTDQLNSPLSLSLSLFAGPSRLGTALPLSGAAAARSDFPRRLIGTVATSRRGLP
ncbi:neuroendocrine convertase 1-like [Frankliniella occidentalis]|uniref:furin n=1 Tax=Frankliniella occidentalis TaxID=133901 RepID=A0A9C6U729_FRAOC|nr:neuroendocrine convertase 1-like [Frankliniella occidentalis]